MSLYTNSCSIGADYPKISGDVGSKIRARTTTTPLGNVVQQKVRSTGPKPRRKQLLHRRAQGRSLMRPGPQNSSSYRIYDLALHEERKSRQSAGQPREDVRSAEVSARCSRALQTYTHGPAVQATGARLTGMCCRPAGRLNRSMRASKHLKARRVLGLRRGRTAASASVPLVPTDSEQHGTRAPGRFPAGAGTAVRDLFGCAVPQAAPLWCGH